MPGENDTRSPLDRYMDRKAEEMARQKAAKERRRRRTIPLVIAGGVLFVALCVLTTVYAVSHQGSCDDYIHTGRNWMRVCS